MFEIISTPYQKRLLTSQIEPARHLFTEQWIKDLLQKPVGKIDTFCNNKTATEDVFIRFGHLSLEIKPSTSYKKRIQLIHRAIRRHIGEASFIQYGHVYQSFETSQTKKEWADVLFFYIHNQPSPNTFNHPKELEKVNGILLNLLVKINILEKMNQSIGCVKSATLNGDFYLSPRINKRVVDGYQFKLSFREGFIDFRLTYQVFQIQDDTSMELDDHFLILDNRELKKIDARQRKRHFLDFHTWAKYRDCRFNTQLILYKTIRETLEKHHIPYNASEFTPTYIYDNFTKFQQHMGQVILASAQPNVITSTLEALIGNHFGLNTRLLISNNLQDYINQTLPILFIQQPVNQEDGFSIKTDPKTQELTYFKNAEEIFIQQKISQLSKSSFFEFVQDFDLYTQIRLYNFWVNTHQSEGNPIATQSLIYDPEIEEDPKKTILTKIIYELSIKHNLYQNKEFSIPGSHSSIQTIDIFQIYRMTKKEKLYGYVRLQYNKHDQQETYFKVMAAKVLNEHEFEDTGFDFNDEEKTLWIINDDIKLSILHNHNNPMIILDAENYNNPLKDPDLISQFQKQKGTDESPPKGMRKVDAESILFFPYTLPSSNTLSGTKKKTNKDSRYACILYQKVSTGRLQLFISIRDTAPDHTSPKNNLLETLLIQKIGTVVDEPLEWGDYPELLQFYFSSIYLNGLITNSISKKTLLTKLGDVLLHN